MEKYEESRYVKLAQKDCTVSFELQIVQEGERKITTISQVKKENGIQYRSTNVQWLRKFGNFDWQNQTHLRCQSHQNKK